MDYKRAVEIDKELEQLYKVRSLIAKDFYNYEPRIHIGGGSSQQLVCDITFRIEHESKSPTDDVEVDGNTLRKKHYNTGKWTVTAFRDNEVRGYAADFLYKAISDKIKERLKEKDKVLGKKDEVEKNETTTKKSQWWKFW